MILKIILSHIFKIQPKNRLFENVKYLKNMYFFIYAKAEFFDFDLE